MSLVEGLNLKLEGDKMRQSIMILESLAKASGPLVKSYVGSGLFGYKFPQGATAETVKNALLYLLLDLSVDLGLRDSIDRKQLEKELGCKEWV